jgi:hypothetical protein
MSERYWRRSMPMSAALLAVAGAAAVAGCSSAGSNGASASTATASSAGMAADTGQNTPATFSAVQLRNALLDKVNGATAAAPAESGLYGTLPDVQTSKESMRDVTVKPAVCAQATVTGFDSAMFADQPASVVTFRVGRDGVSEVIVAADAATAASALAAELPAGCEHYRATVGGKTFGYSVREAVVPGIAEQAAGYADVDVWSVVYQGDGFVGAVTIVGPDATEAGAKLLAKDAYKRAVESLHA